MHHASTEHIAAELASTMELNFQEAHDLLGRLLSRQARRHSAEESRPRGIRDRKRRRTSRSHDARA